MYVDPLYHLFKKTAFGNLSLNFLILALYLLQSGVTLGSAVILANF